MSFTNYLRRKAFVNAIVGESRLSYQEKKGAAPHTKGKTLVMPTYMPDFTYEQDVIWNENLLTLVYSNMEKNLADLDAIIRHNIDMEGQFGEIFNTVAKHNQQFGEAGKLLGADELLEKASELIYSSVDRDNMSPQGHALAALDVWSRQHWQLPTDMGLVSGLEGEAKSLFDKLISEVGDEYVSLRNSGDDNYELTKKIADILGVENESPPSDENGSSNSDEGENGESQEGQGQGEGDGEGEEGKEGSEKSKKVPLVRPTGELPEPAKMGKPAHIHIEDYDTGNPFVPLPSHWIVPKANTTSWMGSDEKPRVQEMTETETLSTKIRNILKVYSQAKWRGGYKTGKINKRRVASVPSGNERIFRQKELKEIHDTAVMVVPDCSGSMCGERHMNSTASCALLVECLGKLNIPVGVAGFTSDYIDHDYSKFCNVMYDIKPFNVKMSKQDIIDRMYAENVELSGNSDAEALLQAYEKLRAQKQKRKIMIVLSDGEPANGTNPTSALKQVVKDISKQRGVELYSIGIQSNAVKRFYPDWKVIQDPSQLEETLLELVKKAILN